jgi:hypothetical protein
VFKTNLSRFSCSNHVCFRGGKPLATPLSFGFLMDVPYMAIGVVGMMMFISKVEAAKSNTPSKTNTYKGLPITNTLLP